MRSADSFDLENLTEDEKQYLRDRISLGYPQPPEDVPYVAGQNDWDEDEVEVVPIGHESAANGQSGQTTASGDDEDTHAGEVDDDGFPVKAGEDGELVFDWDAFSVKQLQAKCEAYELSKSGNKGVLVERLKEYDALPPEGEGD